MAALSSTQSGAFNSSSTWGGSTPADGDTFTINRGHKVTVNSDIRTTNGYGDIQLYGKLEIGYQGQFRLNGRITIRGNGGGYFAEGNTSTSGFLHMTAGSSLEIRGSNDDQHGIWMETEQHCQMIMQGTQKNLNTNLSAATSVDAEYLPVNSASHWAIGDWVTVFNRGEDYRVNGDEGFWVHDVDTSNNRIYFRQFVSPTAEITAVSGTTVTVDNAKVFRKGYKLICDTGSNRRVGTVNSIDYKKNQLTMSVSFASANVGETLYQTGAEKGHVDDAVVRRMATTIKTAISANNTNQITVGNANDISTGDVIIIDVNNDNDTNWDYNTRHTVSSKSGNTLTLDRNVERNINVGALVTIVTRDVKVHAVDESSSTRPFILVERWTSSTGKNRVVILQDVWFKGLGRNTRSTYYNGLMTAGYTSYNVENSSSTDGYHIQSRYDCIVYEQPNYRSSYTGINVRDSRQFVMRNCVSYRCDKGYWGYSGNYNWRLFNCYATRTFYTSFHTDGIYEPYATIQYFYATRSDDYGLMLHHLREQQNIRHVILLNHEQRPLYVFYHNNEIVLERFKIDGYRRFPYIGDRGGRLVLLDSDTRNRWDWTAPDGSGSLYSNYGDYGSSDVSSYYRSTGTTQFVDIIERNFEYDGHAEFSGALLSIWDKEENAWYCKIYNDDNSGKFETVYVPPQTTVRISCEIKIQSGYSGSRPYLLAMQHRNQYNRGRYRTAYTSQTSTQNSTAAANNGIDGFQESVQYSSSAIGSYENKQLTIQPKNKGYYLTYGVSPTSTSIREEHFYMKDVRINMSKAPEISKTKSMRKRIGIRDSFTSAKKRIGGTRL